jgi:hypothetical protein
MSTEIILWIFASVISLLGLVIGFLIKWHLRTDDRLGKTEESLSNFKVDCLRNFVDSGDMGRLNTSIEHLRADLNAISLEMRKELAEVSKGLYQLIGQNSSAKG